MAKATPTPLTMDGREVPYLDLLLARLEQRAQRGDVDAARAAVDIMELRLRYRTMPRRPERWEP